LNLSVQTVQEFRVSTIAHVRVNGYFAVKGAVGEFEGTVGEVTKVGEELVVVLSNEVVPQEASVLVLRTAAEQEVSPNFGWDARFHGVISENTGVATLGEFKGSTILVFFVVKVLSGRDVMELSPWLSRSNKSRGEDHSVECNVILAHELVKLDVIGVLPPLLPLVSVVGRD